MAISTKNRRQEQVVVHQTGHPGAFRKMRCPKCSLGYAVQSNVNKSYVCTRCGSVFNATNI